MRLRIPRPTLGGLQYWADVHFRAGWRVQHHATRSSHFRLLDPWNRLWATGPEDEVRRDLAEIAQERSLAPESGPVVLLLHGIIRTHYSMSPFVPGLRQAGFQVCNLTYPSRIWSIERSADAVGSVVRGLTEATEIHFITHSMGGLVVRRLLATCPDPRYRRFVMLGTPNRGAEKADRFGDWPPFHWLFGPAGQQLRTGPMGICKSLPPRTDIEAAVLAGGTGKRGYSFLLAGDDDGTVTVDCTRMDGLADFLCIPCMHVWMTFSPRVHREATGFLLEGRFPSSQLANLSETA